MSTYIRCPECDERILLSGRARGSRIRCPECRFLFDREERSERDSRSRGRSRRDADSVDEGDDAKQSGVPMQAIIAGGVVLGLLVIGLGIYFVFRGHAKADRQLEVARAQNNDPKAADVNQIPVNNPNGNTNALAPKIQQDKAAAIEWSVPNDPPAESLDFSAKYEKMSFPIPIGGKVFFPRSPSPFLAIGTTLNPSGGIGLFDIRSQKEVGEFAAKSTWSIRLF